MEIYFDHSGKGCKADVIYNFREVGDYFLIVFKGGLGADFLFYKQNNLWVSDFKLQEKHAKTYLNIQKAIIEVFKKDGMLYDLRLQEHLSYSPYADGIAKSVSHFANFHIFTPLYSSIQ